MWRNMCSSACSAATVPQSKTSNSGKKPGRSAILMNRASTIFAPPPARFIRCARSGRPAVLRCRRRAIPATPSAAGIRMKTAPHWSARRATATRRRQIPRSTRSGRRSTTRSPMFMKAPWRPATPRPRRSRASTSATICRPIPRCRAWMATRSRAGRILPRSRTARCRHPTSLRQRRGRWLTTRSPMFMQAPWRPATPRPRRSRASTSATICRPIPRCRAWMATRSRAGRILPRSRTARCRHPTSLRQRRGRWLTTRSPMFMQAPWRPATPRPRRSRASTSATICRPIPRCRAWMATRSQAGRILRRL